MSLRVDLKSQEARRRTPFDYAWLLVALVAGVAFLLFYLGGISLQRKVDAKKAELAQVQQQLGQYAGIQGRLDTLKHDIGVIKGQIDQMRDLRYDPLRYSILLVRISQLLPPNIYLSNLSVDPGSKKVTMACTSVEQPGRPPLASIAQMIMNFQNDKDGYFSNVMMGATSSSGKNGETWGFNLDANYQVSLIGEGAKAPPVSQPGLKRTPAPKAPPAQKATTGGMEKAPPKAPVKGGRK